MNVQAKAIEISARLSVNAMKAMADTLLQLPDDEIRMSLEGIKDAPAELLEHWFMEER